MVLNFIKQKNYNKMEILEQTNKLMSLRQSLPEYKLLQLHPGLDGFNSPNSFGVYKTTGGNALGVVGDKFVPTDLKLFFDNIYENIGDTNLDINTLEFKEYKNGKKISFDIASNDFIVSTSPVKGDVYKVKISFQTGFDGLTRMSLNFKTLRLVCLNGMKNWRQDLAINFKNTKGNQKKVLKFTDEIINIQYQIEDYKTKLEQIATKNITQKEANDFYKQLLGYNYDNYNDLHGKSKSILDEINNSVLIESNSLNLTEFALLNGITRYTTHLKGNKEENYLYGSGMELNTLAHQILLN